LNAAGEEYGRGRLAEVLRSTSHLPAQEVVNRIFADLDAFNTEAFDDQTLIVLKVN
jgi:serine phosphatase RsbU (regulator of sigma subunit)